MFGIFETEQFDNLAIDIDGRTSEKMQFVMMYGVTRL
jgi:hypothetical protein